MEMQNRPSLAIIDPNTLAVIGMKQLLQTAIPLANVRSFCSFDEMICEGESQFFHFFVAMNIVLEHRQFFIERRRRTIVLTTTVSPDKQLSDFNSLCINVSEEQLARQLLHLGRRGHPKGEHLPPRPQQPKALSDREIEVLSLIAQGYLNKEIADQLNIGITTVITHRKNIMEKLSLRSVSALTIYAVMNGYVDINRI
jgi:DNA-binding CsgD family transcriptional regulator